MVTAAFDPAAVARQILNQPPAPLPAQTTVPGSAPGPRKERAPFEVTEEGLLPDSMTDRGLAKAFAHLYARDFRHVNGLGWYRWSGSRWEPDEHDTVVWAVGDMAETIATHDPTGTYTDAEMRRERRRAMSTSGIKAVLQQARAARGMLLDASLLDADPYKLCTPGGIVDLATGALQPPDPECDFHSRSALTAPERMPTPRWDQFLTDTFGDDADGRQMIRYLHLLLGYSITGDVGAQVLAFLYGQGKNGKSVLLDVIVKLMGDYADAAPPGFLMAKPFESHPTDLAELHGRRVIVCSELKSGDRFDESRVKLLTGGDQLKARRMRQDFFSFTPTHKLFLLGNHRPEVGTGGYAFWRRMRLIPFERIIPDERKIDNLADILVREEGPGILAWLIEGARRYLAGEKDLTGPERVRVATTAYAETEDHMGRFLTETCKIEPGLRAEQKHLYLAYCRWCESEGATPVSSRAFAARVRDTLGMRSPKEMATSNQKKYYPGIGLIADLTDEETP
ncbi:phage/plasmid primase, P4 family [Streptomyces sp. RK75]|uniref:DNA primase family protein n=1 Tax=Streptomyces sp. RK75 TaxID=2824895 RepID=UPI001B368EE4|nr:phage/plasmid primase, P4 family [Streptomyces sp. RK75]MBQ0867335.1 DNA primase [Streptomyces sp. RK75]